MRMLWAMLVLCGCTRGGSPAPAPAPAPTPPVAVATKQMAPAPAKTVDQRFAEQPIVANPNPRLFMPCGEKIEAVDGCMVRVPGGTFAMGAQRKDPSQRNYDLNAADDEAPVHEVTLAPYWMHKLEVSAGEFIECVTAGGCQASDVDRSGGLFTGAGRFDHPINGVTWKGASDFCRWIEGRLPTEAEFEFAARGTDGRPYPWGGEPPACPKVSWNNGCGAGGTSLRDFTGGGSVPFGVLALAGSVWEWTADWYDAQAYATPAKAPTGEERVIRGGGWMSTDPVELRSAYRAHMPPDSRMPDVGFRCVRSDH